MLKPTIIIFVKAIVFENRLNLEIKENLILD